MKMTKSNISYSILACWISLFFFIAVRTFYSDLNHRSLKVTTWDAFGYYMYLPSALIYDDATQLEWLPEMDSTYQLTGGELYQANRFTNGNYVNKYLGGVAVLELPFFAIGHLMAGLMGYPMDGFSPPYQYSIAFGALVYVFLALLLMRNVLLRYYSDWVVAFTILSVVLASNLVQYVSVDSAMSHAYIFPLNALVIWGTIKWHEIPRRKLAFLIGWVIGLAMISRPTEAIMLFIPLFWSTHTKEAAKNKWVLVKENRMHVLWALFGGLIGILPQLIYWKMTSGQWIYDVGSKWFFFNPFFRVLFGFENGWFVYTPIAIFFVLGLFLIKQYEFRKSVIIFCLLNIWIVIAWSDWRYGATYSTRALTQSYPIFMLPFAAFVQWIWKSYRKWIAVAVIGFLSYVNILQIWQYNEGVLHYRDMNRKYYSKIYLDWHPTALDMSFLDSDEEPKEVISSSRIVQLDSILRVTNSGEYPDVILKGSTQNVDFVHVKLKLKMNEGFATSYIHCKLVKDEAVKEKVFRIANPITESNERNDYEFYVAVPDELRNGEVLLFLTSFSSIDGQVLEAQIEGVKSEN